MANSPPGASQDDRGDSALRVCLTHRESVTRRHEWGDPMAPAVDTAWSDGPRQILSPGRLLRVAVLQIVLENLGGARRRRNYQRPGQRPHPVSPAEK